MTSEPSHLFVMLVFFFKVVHIDDPSIVSYLYYNNTYFLGFANHVPTSLH